MRKVSNPVLLPKQNMTSHCSSDCSTFNSTTTPHMILLSLVLGMCGSIPERRTSMSTQKTLPHKRHFNGLCVIIQNIIIFVRLCASSHGIRHLGSRRTICVLPAHRSVSSWRYRFFCTFHFHRKWSRGMQVRPAWCREAFGISSFYFSLQRKRCLGWLAVGFDYRIWSRYRALSGSVAATCRNATDKTENKTVYAMLQLCKTVYVIWQLSV